MKKTKRKGNIVIKKFYQKRIKELNKQILDLKELRKLYRGILRRETK